MDPHAFGHCRGAAAPSSLTMTGASCRSRRRRGSAPPRSSRAGYCVTWSGASCRRGPRSKTRSAMRQARSHGISSSRPAPPVTCTSPCRSPSVPRSVQSPRPRSQWRASRHSTASRATGSASLPRSPACPRARKVCGHGSHRDRTHPGQSRRPGDQPGPRRYARSWIRDGATMSAALVRMGCTDEVRDFLDWYARYRDPDGNVPCAVDRKGADWLPGTIATASSSSRWQVLPLHATRLHSALVAGRTARRSWKRCARSAGRNSASPRSARASHPAGVGQPRGLSGAAGSRLLG